MGRLHARAYFNNTTLVAVSLMLLTVVQNPNSVWGQIAPGQIAPGTASNGQAQPGTSNPVTPSEVPRAAPTAPSVSTPPIEFESHGLHYEAITKNNITVMCAALPPHIKDYNVIQVTVTNGSPLPWTVKPEDFTFSRQDGVVLLSSSADQVVATLLEKAGRNDAIKLQILYEATIYALSNFRSTNGYEQRRQAAMAQFVNVKFKAAAQASAITLVPTKLKPGESTDGAVFFENRGKEKTFGPGRLVVHTCGETFEFETTPELKSK
jgi:hypothetical protein